MKIAIIGAGIAGNTIAWHLHKKHEITLFEADEHVGGHTHTHAIHAFGRDFNIDTGFIVYNDWTYPNFIQMLEKLGVETQPSHMSFSVRDEVSGLEYNGTTLNSLFAQRRNFFNPKFLWMIKEILRFNKESPKLLESIDGISFGEYLEKNKYSHGFIKNYIIPMGSAIWSADPKQMLDFPAKFFIRFFHNHGMLSVSNRPQWRVIKGGSEAYVKKLTADFVDRIKVNTPIEAVTRYQDKVMVKPHGGIEEKFDWVFFACHSDEALKLIKSPSPHEKKVLKAIPYSDNEVVLHYDDDFMPKRKLAWAAWNYHINHSDISPVSLTYNMNILQNLKTQAPILVTLNPQKKINKKKIIKTLSYAHPQYSLRSIEAQSNYHLISGVNRTSFAGAYWGNGFHEDGVKSALNAIQQFNLMHGFH